MASILVMIKKIFNFYLSGSIHVALATLSLVLLTYYLNKITVNIYLALFVFFSTILSYNFIKYYQLFQHKRKIDIFIKTLLIVNSLIIPLVFYFFYTLNTQTKWTAVFFSILTFLYAVPIHKSNLRNLAGVKIYLVALCWAGVTLLLPLLQENMLIDSLVIIKLIQRFIFTLILLLIFEISDLKYDNIQLKTIPQTIGIQNTKNVNYLLCTVFFALDFYPFLTFTKQHIITLLVVIMLILFTYFSSNKKNKYYTLFWVESIPIYWLIFSFLIG